MSKREFKITIEYPERTEYEVRINEEFSPRQAISITALRQTRNI